MRSSSASDSSGRVIETISTFSNWCWRRIPVTSRPAEPASERKQGVQEVKRQGSSSASTILCAARLVSVTSEVGIR